MILVTVHVNNTRKEAWKSVTGMDVPIDDMGEYLGESERLDGIAERPGSSFQQRNDEEVSRH